MLFTLFCIGLPESPRWLIIHRNDTTGGLDVLKKVNPDFDQGQLSALVNDIVASGNEKKQSGAFFTKRLFKPIFLAFFIAFFNQLSGINAMSWSDEFFTAFIDKLLKWME